MSAAALTALIAGCRVLCRPRSQTSDAELLRRFTQQRDATAFEELLERYAGLVWGVCRRILPNEADCEDAFQATLLALVRRAGAVEARPSLGAWLHTVAVRVSRKALARSRCQRPQSFVPEPATVGDVADEAGSHELFRIVDEEIERLPALLRLSLILCCLQGRTRDEVADVLGCSVAAVKSRLERGRDLLRRRLQQRGVELPAAFLVLGLTGERICSALWAKTMQSALYTPSPTIVALAEASTSAGTMGKGKLLLAALLLVSSAAGAAGTLLMEKPAETPAFPQATPSAAEKRNQTPQVRKDRHRDPLPDGAIARLGTLRWQHGFDISELAYSPDGKKIAAVGGGRIILWDAATGKEVRQFPNRMEIEGGLAFSPDGKVLATATTPSYLWDVATGKKLAKLQGHQNATRSIAFSPDGKRVATASADGTIRLWDAANGKEQRSIDAAGEVCCMAYSLDGKWIASASVDGTIHLWDPITGKERRQLSGHKESVWRIVFSPDGKRLAWSSYDGTIRLWDMTTSKQSHLLGEKQERDLIPIAFSPDGALLASGHLDGTIGLWDVGDRREKRRWQTGALRVRDIAFSPDGKTLASGMAWGSIRLWDVATGRERYPSEEPRGKINFVRFSPDGTSLISISADRRGMTWWDLATQMPRRQFTWTIKGRNQTALSPEGDYRTMLSPDGNTLAVGSYSDSEQSLWEVRLWDVRSGKPSRLLGKYEWGGLWPIVFSPDGRLVASGGYAGKDCVLHIWDVSTGKEVRQFKDVPVYSLCFSPDSMALACGSGESWRPNAPAGPLLYLWDVASGKERVKFDVSTRESPHCSEVAFSPDGKVLALVTGHRDQTSMVRLWNTATGKELCRHTGHREWVAAIAFSPDGKLVVSGCGYNGTKDNSVHVWEAATGRLIRHFEGHHSCVSSVDFSLDGLVVASGAGDIVDPENRTTR